MLTQSLYTERFFDFRSYNIIYHSRGRGELAAVLVAKLAPPVEDPSYVRVSIFHIQNRDSTRKDACRS
jgi:hypothetical protein